MRASLFLCILVASCSDPVVATRFDLGVPRDAAAHDMSAQPRPDMGAATPDMGAATPDMGAPDEAIASDLCEDAPVVTRLGHDVISGDMAAYTSDGDELCDSDTGGNNAFFEFVAPETGWYAFDTSPTTVDTVLGIRRGSCAAAVLEGECNDDTEHDDEAYWSELAVRLTAGEHVFVEILAYGEEDNEGTFTVNVSPTTAPPLEVLDAGASPDAS